MSETEKQEILYKIIENQAILGEKVDNLSKQFDKMDVKIDSTNKKVDDITAQQNQGSGAASFKKWIQEKFWIPILLLIIGYIATNFMNTVNRLMEFMAQNSIKP